MARRWVAVEGGRNPKVSTVRGRVIVARKWRKAEKNSIEENKKEQRDERGLGSRREGRKEWMLKERGWRW